MTLNVIPLVGVDRIRFGMKRCEVRSVWGGKDNDYPDIVKIAIFSHNIVNYRTKGYISGIDL